MAAGAAEARPDGLRYVVAVGASAGGLEALQDFLHGLDGAVGAAFVVVQHLAPDHRSVLVELLARETPLPVAPVVDGTTVEPGSIYVAAPGQDVTVDEAAVLHVTDSAGGPTPSIDRLFAAVADGWGPHGVGVLLSGTGSDGTHGLRRIKAAEGLTIAQLPESARFEAMPRSAIDLGLVDLVLRPGEVGPALARLASTGPAWLGEGVPADQQPTLSNVVAQLRKVTGVDFSRYKESTLRRQVGRRMAIRQLGGVEDYLPVLHSEPAEARALMANLLVTVTSFFRDPDAFAALAVHLASYARNRPPDEPMRIWVPGCATGEEVYSVAMLASEALGRPGDLDQRLKVFGTDLDESSLGVARRGIYPGSAVASVPDELRVRYLIDHGPDVEVAPEIRDCVVFARHNVTQDPPFPRTDLVSCRNTLIYFTTPLQARVLDFLRYSLRPGGLLFLGQSESIGSDTGAFVPLDARQRVFARSVEPPTVAPSPGPVSPWRAADAQTRPRAVRTQSAPEPRTALLETMLRTIAPPSLVVDAAFEVVEISGDVSSFCQVSSGPVSPAVASLLRPELRGEARHLLLQLRAGADAAASEPIRLDPLPPVRLEARRMGTEASPFTVLSFVAVPEGSSPDVMPLGDGVLDRELERLEHELLTSQERLAASLEELEAANEELQASAEELQATNEELQSSYEELETSNEELQATNEELGNLNQQHRLRSEELSLVNDDLVNVQSSLSQGMVLVDEDLRVTRYSPLAVRLFALVEDDVGRSLLHVPTTLDVAGLADALHEVVSGQGRRSLEVHGADVSFLVQVLPYVASRGGRRGAIITLTDVSELVQLRRTAESALREFTATTDALAELVWKRDASTGAVVYVSQRVEDFIGHSQSEVHAAPALLDAAIVEEDRERVRSARASNTSGWSVEYRMRSTTGVERWVRETARLILEEDGGALAGTVVDVSDRVVAEQVAAERAEQLAAQASHDASTGLLNRDAFGQELTRELARAHRSGGVVALVWVDLDLFKQVNDEHGHDVGDQALRQVADRLRSVTREQDSVGRLGGDEFGIIVSGLALPEELDPFLFRVLEAMREPIRVGDLEVGITASLGVALGPADGDTPVALMRAADEAMYAVKAAGGDQAAYFEAAMSTRVDERRMKLRELSAALKEPVFELHYQPIVNLLDDRLWGLEALVRWRRGGEVVTANEFVPFCEDTGLIRTLGIVSIDLLADDRATLVAAGLDRVSLTLNLSVKELEGPGALERLRAWTSPPGVRGLVVEVTESVFLPDHSRALAALATLRGLGATVAIDDFGSGFSNLRLLESLAPTYIKLDSSFLAIADDQGQDSLLRAAVDLTHAMGARVIAEGIEGEQQRVRVLRLGAELGQGFGIARPMRLAEAVQWAKRSADGTHLDPSG